MYSFTKKHIYTEIDDLETARKSSPPGKNYKLNRHIYTEIDDDRVKQEVHFRPPKEPPYEEAWDRFSIPSAVLKQASGTKRRESDVPALVRTATFPQAGMSKAAPHPRHKSVDFTSSGTKL